MNQHVRTPRSVIFTLSGGFVLGAICTGAIISGAGLDRAVAAPQLMVKPRLMSSSATEDMTALHSLDSSFRNLAKFVGPAVVDIQTQSDRAMSQDGAREPVTTGEGSGFLFSPDGYIATNDHVVGTADTVQVTLKDGRQFTGKVTRGNDSNSDIALVRIEGKNLPYISFADSTKVDPGELAMAIGAPFGLENSVTVGHISALGRSSLIEKRVYTDLLQTDAAINMGNSGGPLVNVDGQVIGMNTAIESPTGGSNGIGFAIPSNQVKMIETLLVTKGKITRSMIGLVPEDVKEWERAGASPTYPDGGARVELVEPGSPAAVAHIQKGDVIVKIGSTDVHGQLDLRNAMLIYQPNTTVPVTYVRNGHRTTVQVKLKPYELPKVPQQQEQPGGRQFDPFGNGSPFGNMPGNPFGNDNGDVAPHPHSGPAQLGVQVNNIDEAMHSQYSIPAGVHGAAVVGVAPGSVAASIGIEPGDVIISLAGKTINSLEDVQTAMKSVTWGSVAHITFNRYDDSGRALKHDIDVKFQ